MLQNSHLKLLFSTWLELMVAAISELSIIAGGSIELTTGVDGGVEKSKATKVGKMKMGQVYIGFSRDAPSLGVSTDACVLDSTECSKSLFWLNSVVFS